MGLTEDEIKSSESEGVPSKPIKNRFLATFLPISRKRKTDCHEISIKLQSHRY